MYLNGTCTVEFLGGPLDGFLRKIPATKPSSQYVVVPINVQLLRLATGQELDSDAAATSVAIYCLRTNGTDHFYRFLMSVSPNEW